MNQQQRKNAQRLTDKDIDLDFLRVMSRACRASNLTEVANTYDWCIEKIEQQQEEIRLLNNALDSSTRQFAIGPEHVKALT